MNLTVTAVIVTYNRKELLKTCLAAMLAQTRKPDHILVVDNASTDGTRAMLTEAGWLSRFGIELLALTNNTGGAGGFMAGIVHALKGQADWIWIMDDDARPEPGALDALLRADPDPNAMYAAAALADTDDLAELVWPAVPTSVEGSGKSMICKNELPATPFPVTNAPFIGMLIHRHLVARIGLPDPDFFVSGDDADYCARAWTAGSGVWLVPRAVVRHPRIPRRCFRLGTRQICVLQVTPWRRYYDTRNRLIIARRHFGRRLWTEVLPGTLIRWLVTLIVQPERMAQSAAFARGIRDGLAERLGIRWPPP